MNTSTGTQAGPGGRREDQRLLRGQGRFVGDLHRSGLLYGAVLRSSHAHARILSIDLSAARALPGVVEIITAAELGSAAQPLPSPLRLPQNWVDRYCRVVRTPDVFPLARERALYAGQPLAFVVAESRYVAEDALDLITVEYESLPAVTDAEQAMDAASVRLYPDWEENLMLHVRVEHGDAEDAIRRAPRVLRDRLEIQRQTGAPMEPRGVMAEPDLRGGLTVWSGTQAVHGLRANLARFLGLAEFQIRVIAPDVGGGFGVKAFFYPEEILVALMAHRLGRPVKWQADRLEDLQGGIHSREQSHDVTVAFDETGRILALRDRFYVDTGAYSPSPGALPTVTLCHMLAPYRIPAFSCEAMQVVTNKAPCAPVRGSGRPEAVFVMDRVLDRIALELGLDSAEVRRRNLVTAAEMPYAVGIPFRDGNPMVLDSGDYPALLEQCLELIGYQEIRRKQQDGWNEGKYIGVGLSCSVEATGAGPFEGARVVVDPSGRVVVYTGAAAQGQGHETVFSRLVADALGVPVEDVVVVGGDTDGIPYGVGTFASRTIVTAGNAVRTAAEAVGARCLELAAGRLECATADLEFSGGWVRIKGAPSRGVRLGELAASCSPALRAPGETEAGLTATRYFQPPAVTWAAGVHAAVVEVDTQTGQVKLLDYAVVHDCGRVLQPKLVHGQVVGGVVHGIGGALYEELKYGAAGELQTASLMDYLLPGATEVPPIKVGHMESPSPLNPLGVKGAGEAGTLGPAAAISGAVEDALRPLGVRIHRTPLSPSAVHELIHART